MAETLPPLAEGLESTRRRIRRTACSSPQDGATHHLSEFKGRGMVVNMWATWCAPCVAEMPSLEALSKALAPQDIAVLPLSSDRGGAERLQAWYQAHGITALPVLLDPKGAMAGRSTPAASRPRSSSTPPGRLSPGWRARPTGHPRMRKA